jgi:hypothetical protein
LGGASTLFTTRVEHTAALQDSVDSKSRLTLPTTAKR